MNRQAQAIMLFLLGGAVLRAGSSGLYLRYVKAGLRPLLLAAGIVLIATAIATIGYEIRRPRTSEHGHRHGHGEPRVSWFLVLPLLALILVTPPALGSYSAGRAGTALSPPLGFSALPTGDPLKLQVLDYADRAVYDHGRSLTGRRIEITGFITPGSSGSAYLVRMILNCCAADAQPIKVGLAGRTPPILAAGTWVDVIGIYTAKRTRDPINGGVIPFIDVTRLERVPRPHDLYES